MIKTNYFIITGGPGMGKTALIDRLREKGYTCVPETGRAIIQEQMASGGSALPWMNRCEFAQQMFLQAVADFTQMQSLQSPVFFDRGIPDVPGYLKLCSLPVPADIMKTAEQWRYNPLVFITPPWEDIFRNDKERKQTFEEAARTYEAMKKTYMRLGYQLEELPKTGIGARVDHMLAIVHQQPGVPGACGQISGPT